MNIVDMLTLDALLVALKVRQAQRELDAAVLLAEIAMREQAQKSRPVL